MAPGPEELDLDALLAAPSWFRGGLRQQTQGGNRSAADGNNLFSRKHAVQRSIPQSQRRTTPQTPKAPLSRQPRPAPGRPDPRTLQRRQLASLLDAAQGNNPAAVPAAKQGDVTTAAAPGGAAADSDLEDALPPAIIKPALSSRSALQLSRNVSRPVGHLQTCSRPAQRPAADQPAIAQPAFPAAPAAATAQSSGGPAQQQSMLPAADRATEPVPKVNEARPAPAAAAPPAQQQQLQQQQQQPSPSGGGPAAAAHEPLQNVAAAGLGVLPDGNDVRSQQRPTATLDALLQRAPSAGTTAARAARRQRPIAQNSVLRQAPSSPVYAAVLHAVFS